VLCRAPFLASGAPERRRNCSELRLLLVRQLGATLAQRLTCRLRAAGGGGAEAGQAAWLEAELRARTGCAGGGRSSSSLVQLAQRLLFEEEHLAEAGANSRA